MRLRSLPPAVWALGWVSFCTDAATEMIYPVLPLFLAHTLGAGALPLGIIEGAAEAANSVLKIAAGRLSDRWRARRPIVIAGYTISSAARPLIALATAWPQVLAVRFADRVGKGIRGAPRDAILAAVSPVEARGLVFGFHRAMDHAGAVVGPLIAALFLLAWPGQYRQLFALTIIPGIIAVALLFRVKEPGPASSVPSPDVKQSRPEPRGPSPDPKRPWPEPPGPRPASGIFHGARGPTPARSRLAHARSARAAGAPPAPGLTRLLMVIFIFTLGNSADAFLLLRLSDAGLAAAGVPLAWAALHVVKAACSVAGGALSDRLDRRVVIALGWIVYAMVYGGFAISSSVVALMAWFLSYGLFYGLTEGVEKALVADLAPADRRGTAFGYYNATLGMGMLIASVAFGFIWRTYGHEAAFATGAALALAASGLLFVMVPKR